MSQTDVGVAGLFVGPESGCVAGRTGHGVSVAVIDSGIHPGHPHVGGLVSGIAFLDDGRPHEDLIDRLGHGTAVAAAIHEKAPGADLHIARVFQDTLSTTIDALVAALDWAVGRGARLINLSLGTANPDNAPALLKAADRARAAGAIIVSAREDGARRWYPGSLPGVVGVVLDWSCPREGVRIESGSESVLVSAAGYPRPIPGVPPARNLNGISFAVANATGILACLLEGHPEVRTATDLRELVAARSAEPMVR